MKYLVVAALGVVVFWLGRNNREAEKKETAATRPPSPPRQATEVTEMVACEVCQVHLPRSEALIGLKGGFYCSDAHRRQAGG